MGPPLQPVHPGVFFDPPVALPRGRHRLPRTAVLAAQRERLMVAFTELLADRGFAAVAVADVARRAGVSRSAFYVAFADKQACAFAAYDRFIEVLLAEVRDALATTGSVDEVLGAAIGAYFSTLRRDLVVGRAFQVEIDAVGPAARERRRRSLDRFAAALRDRHRRLRDADPRLPDVGHVAFVGLIYAVRQLACDLLEREADPDFDALLPELRPWIAAGFGPRP
ncbi:TetR/AcrR family transcriptional regulator [Patulibacter defluvii]|uniref:TetR/AcrR family transcriptional regulator n=1 Tax=Patulibacter defluvii TaxID=3095358 RepID=UPI002A75457A|nr:TetR/AcrR family transcriptional regulator [Patulibacter sp. DM4]